MSTQTEIRYGEFRQIDEENRTADFVISTSAKDRHGTVVNMNNWDISKFNQNGIVGYQHDVYGGDMCNKPDPDDVIGRGEVFFENQRDINSESKLIGRVHFEDAETNPKADKIWRKVKAGTLRATSVGFIPIEDENGNIGNWGYRDENDEIVDSDTFYFHGQELLEFSIVNIPSNPEALGKTLRSHAHNAISMIKERLGDGYSYSDIESMKVGDILKFLEGGKKPELNKAFDQDANEEDEGNGKGEGIEDGYNKLKYKRKLIDVKLKQLEQ